jgi:hypothetical protein
MVAAAGGEERELPPLAAVACVALFAVAVGVHLLAASRFPELSGLLGLAPTPEAPAVLVREAGRILGTLGLDTPHADRAFGFDADWEYLRWVEENDPSHDRWARLAGPRRPGLLFWYRQSPRPLVPELGADTIVTFGDPRLAYSGEVAMLLDTAGRLVTFEAVPAELVETTAEAAGEPDWLALFAAAELDLADYASATPVWSPPRFADRRVAWERLDPGRTELPARIEAAAFRGRPVWFAFKNPWDTPTRMVERESSFGEKLWTFFLVVSLLSIIGVSLVLARRNLRLGRGDRRGALEVAMFVALAMTTYNALVASHVPDLAQEFNLMMNTLFVTSFLGCISWLAYVTLEPFLRRRWPDAMISWNRLLEGRFLDPRIGRDVVVAAAGAGLVTLVVHTGMPLARRLTGVAPSLLERTSLQLLHGGRWVLASIVVGALFALLITMFFLFVLLLLRIVLRKHWLAVGAIVLLLSGGAASEGSQPLWEFSAEALLWTMVLTLLTRFGLLSAVVFFYFVWLLDRIPSADLSAWYSAGTVAVLAVLAGVAGIGLHSAIGGRPLFGESFVPAE